MVAVISQHHPNKSARHDDDDLDDDDGDYDGHDHDDALDDDDWVYRFSPKVGFGLRRFSKQAIWTGPTPKRSQRRGLQTPR